MIPDHHVGREWSAAGGLVEFDAEFLTGLFAGDGQGTVDSRQDDVEPRTIDSIQHAGCADALMRLPDGMVVAVSLRRPRRCSLSVDRMVRWRRGAKRRAGRIGARWEWTVMVIDGRSGRTALLRITLRSNGAAKLFGTPDG